MSASVACFDNVFGLSRTGCDCFTDGMPTDADVSNSGLFLDETPALNLTRIFSGSGCEDTGWGILTKAREHGVQAFRDKVIALVRQDSKWKRTPTRSKIADDKATKEVRLLKSYHGVELVFASHFGGTATIKAIGGAFKFTGSVDVSIYDDASDTPLDTFTITATQNSRVWTQIEPFEIDLTAYGSDNPRYWLLFEPTDGQKALNSKVASCGCSGKPKWNINAPYYESGVAIDGQAWTAWAMAAGTYGDDLAERDSWIHANETQGLMLDIEFKCDARTVVCSGEPDYQQDPLQQAFAWGSRYEAALYIVDYLTGSTRVNREALAGGEELEQLRVSYMAKVKESSEWLAEQLTAEPDDENPRSGINTYSDCFACRDQHGMKVQTIRR